MSRWWTDLVAAASDVVPLPLLFLLLLVAAALTGALWYWFPAWVPRRLPRLRRPRFGRPRLRRTSWRWPRFGRPRLRRTSWRWPRWSWTWLSTLRWPWRRRKPTSAPDAVADLRPAAGDAVPDLPADALASLADRLAAEGRYAEAIRERLRAVVRRLVEHGVIAHHPGWTVTELAGAAGGALPAVQAPLAAAGAVFSEVWYGRRTAHAGTDATMRELAEAVNGSLRRLASERRRSDARIAVEGGRG